MTITPVKIGNKVIGPDHPCYLIAEVGTTCLGDLDKALRLIRAGAEAGVDAVKFQVIEPDQLSDKSVTYTIKTGSVTRQVNMHDMFTQLANFTEAQWKEIAAACRDAGVEFFATVDYMAGVDLLDRVGVAVHKMGAWDATYRPLIEHIGRTGKPLFCDLGPCTEQEAEELVEWYKSAGGSAVLFMHDFHTDVAAEMNMQAIPYLNKKYGWPAGFSAPALDHDIDFAAVALGSYHLEKRLILDRNEPAFHAHESCEPDELKDWVRRVRHVESTLGRPAIVPTKRDIEMSAQYYRSICTTKPIKAGEVFSPENLDGKRPGTGLPTRLLPSIWGQRATRDLPVDTLIELGDTA